MHHIYDRTAVPQLVNLAINKDLLRQVKKLDINLAKELEAIIIAKLEIAAKKEWAENNLKLLNNLANIA